MYLTKKYQMLMSLVLFLLYTFPFFYNNMAIMLLWYILYIPTRYPLTSKEYFSHNSCIIMSSVATISVSVELLVFIFYMWDVEYITPFPIGIIPPVWILMSPCTV